jgi:hypothetical protein
VPFYAGERKRKVGQSEFIPQRASESDFSVKMLVTRNAAWLVGPVSIKCVKKGRIENILGGTETENRHVTTGENK